jgi:hypothetical protein
MLFLNMVCLTVASTCCGEGEDKNGSQEMEDCFEDRHSFWGKKL